MDALLTQEQGRDAYSDILSPREKSLLPPERATLGEQVLRPPHTHPVGCRGVGGVCIHGSVGKVPGELLQLLHRTALGLQGSVKGKRHKRSLRGAVTSRVTEGKRNTGQREERAREPS